MEELYQKIALKHGIPKSEVKDIFVSQFTCLKDTIKKLDVYNDYFPYVSLPFSITFKVTEKRKYFLKRKYNNRIKDVYPQQGTSGSGATGTSDSGI